MKRYLIIVFYLFCSVKFINAQNDNFKFDHLTVENGLSANTVLCLYQDSRGFLWIGTYNGLNRYDGYKFKIFKNDISDSTSISDNQIRAICEDNKGNLWIGTWTGGLNKFNRDTETFQRYKYSPDSLNCISSNSVFALSKDKSGNIWIGTGGGGLNKLNIDDESFSCYKNIPGDTSSLNDNQIYSIYIDKEGYIWLGTHKGGLNKFDKSSNKFLHYMHDPKNENSISSNWIVSIDEDSYGFLWLGTMGGRIDILDKKNNRFISCLNNDLTQQCISMSNAWCISEDKEGMFWIGTYDSGLGIFNRKENKLIHLIKDYKNPYGLNDNSVFSICEDNTGIVWIGTWSGGLNKFDKIKQKFITLMHDPMQTNSISTNSIYSIYEDNFNELWIGTDVGGVDRINKTRTKVTHYTNSPGNLYSLSSNNITSICEDQENNIWIGTDGGGLNKFNRQTNKFIHFENDPGNPNSLGSDKISKIICDSYGNLWIGAAGIGLDKLEKDSYHFKHYKYDPNNKNSISKNLVYSLYEDRSGNIMVGTRGGGLSIFNRITEEFKHFKFNPEKPNTSLSNNVVSAIYEDSKGNYWIGTDGGGLNKFDINNNQFIHYTEKDGLANNVICGILEDNYGNLWISTGNGISKFNYSLKSFINYYSEDGLQGNEFNQGASFKNSKGIMYFGGNNGLNEFNPNEIILDKSIPNVLITDFQLMHRPVKIGYDNIWDRTILKKSIIETEKIELNYDDNIIAFEISVIDFKNPSKNNYAYYMEGFDKEWTYKDASQRLVTYTNLNPGEYIFKVKGGNRDGIWNEKGRSLSIIINHPWWATWWAYSLYAITFLFIFSSSTRFYLNRQKLRHQLELEQEHSEKLAEVDRMKSHFFANISHEFRTPLTLILGPSEDILNKSKDINAKNQAEIIKRNANRLLSLISQLLDLSKLDEGKLKLQATKQNIVSFIKGTVMSFETFAELKDLSLNIKSKKDDIQLYFDKDKMEKIITNLIANAIKFTPKGGEVKVKIEETDQNKIEIKICDTGIGIPDKELPKLFDRFYQVDSSQTREFEGSGLGLSLTKELVELHHGSITVKSKEQNPVSQKPGWTIFTIVLPLGHSHLKPDEIVKSEIHTEKSSINLDDETIFKKSLNENKKFIETKDNKTIILVVEDNKEVREYIRNNLCDDYIIEEAVNGEQGVRKAEEIIPDLILSDIMMPKMDGNKLTNILKNGISTSHIPIILLTAKSEMESKLNGYKLGADDYMVKPFNTKELKTRIKNLIDNRRKLQKIFSKAEFTMQRSNIKLSNIDKNFINKINEVIENHISEEEFSIEEMGKDISLSRSQIHRKLKALTGKSPCLYLRSIRLAKAKKLIEERIGNISEVAYSTGFSSPAYFTKCFKEEYGITPSELNH